MLKQALFLLLATSSMAAVVVPFNQVILANAPRLVLKFYKPGCRPCVTLASTYKDLSNSAEFKDHVIFMEINVEEYPQIAQSYAVRGVPTIIYFKNGVKVYSGMPGRSDIAQEIKTYLM